MSLSYLIINAQAHQTVLHEYEVEKAPFFMKLLGLFSDSYHLEQSESSQKTLPKTSSLRKKKKENRECVIQ